MPCGERRSDCHDDSSLTIALSRVGYLEACLCALLTELTQYEFGGRIISDASKNGQIDISGFWKEHSKEDAARLLDSLKKYSSHELENIYKILNAVVQIDDDI